MERLIQQWKDWTFLEAAPFWSKAGFNTDSGLFRERLSFSGEPEDPEALRLMAQMRQVASFAALATFPEGKAEWGALALSVMARLEKLYHQRDGEKGWIFSIDAQGEIADPKRDLYAHAFVLFAYAALGKFLEKSGEEAAFEALQKKTLERGKEIFTLFGVENAGGVFQVFQSWREVLPYTHEHCQNPWMHLLEACLALFEVFGDQIWKQRAKIILKLLRTYLLTSVGLMPERFNDAWKTFRKEGKNLIEPGHLFEWGWLLGESRRLLKLDESEERQITSISEKFIFFAKKYGSAPSGGTHLVVNEVFETGKMADPAVRLWPQTEYIRLLAADYSGFESKEACRILQKKSEIFFKYFAPPDLKGGWVDRLTAQHAKAVSYMPATSFYHIVSACTSICGMEIDKWRCDDL